MPGSWVFHDFCDLALLKLGYLCPLAWFNLVPSLLAAALDSTFFIQNQPPWGQCYLCFEPLFRSWLKLNERVSLHDFMWTRKRQDLFSWTTTSLTKLPVQRLLEEGGLALLLLLGACFLLTYIIHFFLLLSPWTSKHQLFLLLMRTPHYLTAKTPHRGFPTTSWCLPLGPSESLSPWQMYCLPIPFPHRTHLPFPRGPSCWKRADTGGHIPMHDKDLCLKSEGEKKKKSMLSTRLFWIIKQLNHGAERDLRDHVAQWLLGFEISQTFPRKWNWVGKEGCASPAALTILS